MPRNEEISGVFHGEKNVFDNGPDNRTIIGQIGPSLKSYDLTTVKGDAPEGELQRGMKYRFYGRWVNHHTYGKQFLFNSYVAEEPAGKDGVVAYLLQCDGIGHATAEALWRKYEDKAVETLRESPLKVSQDIPKLKIAMTTAASEYLRTMQTVERCKIDLMNILNGKGLPKKLIPKLIFDYGNQAAEKIRQDAFILMRYPGVGFQKADALFLFLKGDPGLLKRQALCLKDSVYRDRGGNTWVPGLATLEALSKSIAATKIKKKEALELALSERMIVGRRDSANTAWLALHHNAVNEESVVRSLLLLKTTATDLLLWPDVNTIDKLYDDEPGLPDEEKWHQRDQLALSLREHVGYLAGSPGTGKTHVLAQLIKAIFTQGICRREELKVVAPTGKAAVRVTMNLEKAGVSGFRATTIHSLLEVVGDDGGGGFAFARNRSNPLDCMFLFIDEGSMADTNILAQLLEAVPEGCHVLIVGDPNQLSPVGPGAPLRDIMLSGVICGGMLTRIRRNAGRVVRACAQMRDNKDGRFDVSPKFDLPTENLVCVERSTPEDQIDCVLKMVNSIRAKREFDPISDVQVIVAVNRKSKLGRREVNAALQTLLNPTGKQAAGNPFRVGDKIINLQNGRFPVDDTRYEINVHDYPDPEHKYYVANGEQAIVTEVTPTLTFARLTDPLRVIKIPRGNQKDEENGGDDEESSDTGCKWDLGYAISGHKSQGSEWPIVIILIDDSGGARHVCNKEWMFTTTSRIRVMGALVGKLNVAYEFCTRTGLQKRKTFLKEDLIAKLPEYLENREGKIAEIEEAMRREEERRMEYAKQREAERREALGLPPKGQAEPELDDEQIKNPFDEDEPVDPSKVTHDMEDGGYIIDVEVIKPQPKKLPKPTRLGDLRLPAPGDNFNG
jgi:exodeoxyribonuclease V alpha subunit